MNDFPLDDSIQAETRRKESCKQIKENLIWFSTLQKWNFINLQYFNKEFLLGIINPTYFSFRLYYL